MRITLPSLVLIICAGCGGIKWPLPLNSPPSTNDVFVLDWTGGSSPLWPDGELPPIDLSEFELDGGGTLADIPGFTGMVEDKVRLIFETAGIEVSVITGEQRWQANNVHISPVSDPDSGKTLGRGHYDPCNRSHDDSCILYAASVVDGGPCAIGEWVNIFANICAHEMAHNLGFGHAGTSELVFPPGFTELMSAGHTWTQQRGEQRFLVEQDTCPDLTNAKVPDSMPCGGTE